MGTEAEEELEVEEGEVLEELQVLEEVDDRKIHFGVKKNSSP